MLVWKPRNYRRNNATRSTQRGDTVVEVLIAVAIISSVLVAAFGVSQKSSTAVREGQEHAEAQHVLQSQVELVRSMALASPNMTSGVFATSPKYFCVNGTDPAAPVRVDLPGLGGNLPVRDSDNFSGYSAPGPCAEIQGRYYVSVSYDGPPPGASGIFHFTARWDNLLGGKNEEKMSYRVYSGDTFSSTASATSAVSAAISSAPCTIDPATGSCAAAPASYRWTVYLLNKTANPGLTVSGCTWDWSDGKQITNASCSDSDLIQHSYAVPGGFPAYPASCNTRPEGVRLTVKYVEGYTAIKDYNYTMPRCN